MSIEERHAKGCASERGKRCNCVAHYRGEVRDARGRKVRSGWSTSRAQAVAWEEEAVVAVRRGRLRASTPTTVRQAGHRARRRDAIRSDPRSQRQAIQAQDRPHLRARAGDLHLPAAGQPEGQLASTRGHAGLRRGDAGARCGAVDGAQPARSAAGDRPALDRQRRAARRSVRAPEDAGRPEQSNADRILDDRRGADRGAAGIRAGVLGARAIRRRATRRAPRPAGRRHRLRRRARTRSSRLGRPRGRDRPEDVRRRARHPDDRRATSHLPRAQAPDRPARSRSCSSAAPRRTRSIRRRSARGR